MKVIFTSLLLMVVASHVYSFSRKEKEQELEESLLKAIEEKSRGGEYVPENESEDEEDDEIMDEIYEDYKRDPKAWWSSRKANKVERTGEGNGSGSGGRTKPTQPTRRHRWLRFKQKAGHFFNGVHHALKKAHEYAPHIIKGVGIAASLLGKKKRELVELERKQRRVRDDIRDIEDEILMKKKK